MHRSRQMSLLQALKGSLIVSCQPVRQGPLDHPSIVRAFALAAERGGARGLRIEGRADLEAVREATQLPLIGLIKRPLREFPIYITPFLEDLEAVLDRGADLVAVDATLRPRPVPLEVLIERAHARGRLLVADVAKVDEGLRAHDLGADLVSTALSGYTEESQASSGPDLELVEALAQKGIKVLAEGRIWSPEEAQEAMHRGAFAVVVGSAITRPELITHRFVEALEVEDAERTGQLERP